MNGLDPWRVKLGAFPWEYFATLTFRPGRSRRSLTPGLVEQSLVAWVRVVSDELGTRFRRVLWCARIEVGSLGRIHAHALVKLRDAGPSRRNTWAMRQAWYEKLDFGFADVRLFDTNLPGVCYVLKGIESEALTGLGARDAYELSRFDRNDACQRQLILSTALLDAMGAGRRDKGLQKREARPLGSSTLRDRSGLGGWYARHPADMSDARITY